MPEVALECWGVLKAGLSLLHDRGTLKLKGCSLGPAKRAFTETQSENRSTDLVLTEEETGQLSIIAKGQFIL